ncbi:EndoU domain-containing protein [Rhodocista pekingensis]|uniref:EndoU domain-containing protein n=1 Tax=Rhodocista pekingensis TaxID=201185 RepID=A0ABW2KVV8_9PROT
MLVAGVGVDPSPMPGAGRPITAPGRVPGSDLITPPAPHSPHHYIQESLVAGEPVPPISKGWLYRGVRTGNQTQGFVARPKGTDPAPAYARLMQITGAPDHTGVYKGMVLYRQGGTIQQGESVFFPDRYDEGHLMCALQAAYGRRHRSHDGQWEATLDDGTVVEFRSGYDGALWPVPVYVPPLSGEASPS